jgi:transcriptional regulator with XRE-family HTH domain
MREDLLPLLGETLRNRRRTRKMTQPMLASRVGRSTPRISDLEKDLLAGRLGKDRLGLLAEVCDALDLIPVLVPREQAQAVRRLLGAGPSPTSGVSVGRAFDDLFVDLSDDEDGDEDDR